MGMLGNLFRRFTEAPGDAAEETAEAVEYKGFSIRPTFRRNGSQWMTAGRISKASAEGEKTHDFIRADTHPTKDDAVTCTIAKAKRTIDEQGDGLFGEG